jgi:hypothetical protein
MTGYNETIRALAEMTDSALFERLAAAVLRQAAPDLYGNLVHTGVNTEGKTIKAPVDGVAFVLASGPEHIVIAHHTTTMLDDLKNKWLHDPSNVVGRKGGKPTAPPGDVIKTITVVERERTRTPTLRATLALTTNREPVADLVIDVRERQVNTTLMSISGRVPGLLTTDTDRMGNGYGRLTLAFRSNDYRSNFCWTSPAEAWTPFL